MTEPLMAPTTLFRFAIGCPYVQTAWGRSGAKLETVPPLPHCAAIDGQPTWATVWAAWNEQGLAFRIEVRGKSQPPFCDVNRPDDSDAVLLWIDTRATHNIHRASRFCHCFLALPRGGGKRGEDALGGLVEIPRARENPRVPKPSDMAVKRKDLDDGYRLDVWLAADALTGYAPEEQPRLGFCYEVKDQELGLQTFNCETSLPYQSDPSLWATLELTR